MPDPIDTDAVNAAGDIVSHVITLNIGARRDGSRTINYRGTTLSCERRGPELIWKVGRDFMSPIYWHAHFKLRPLQEQRDIIARIVSRPVE